MTHCPVTSTCEWDCTLGVQCPRLPEALAQARSEIAALKGALADAICRPEGVVPESAEGLVTQDDLQAAEERRVEQALTDLARLGQEWDAAPQSLASQPTSSDGD